MKRVLSSVFTIVFLAGCGARVDSGAGRGAAETEEEVAVVNLQVTEYKDVEAFEKIISELEASNLTATVLTTGEFATENCERFRALDQQGFEIMAFARPQSQDGQSVTLSMLSYQEQEELISETKTAIEGCLGKSIAGFRCTRFDQNEDTYEIVSALAFEYNLGFVAQTGRCLPGHEEDTLPYRDPDYGFWAVPMYSVYYDEEWVAFCDNPFRDRVDADEWANLLKSQLDATCSEGRLLLVEVHPYYSGVDEGRFDAFVSFLDYATQNRARFVTVAELVAQFGVDSSQVQDGEDEDKVCEPCQLD